MQAEVPAFSKLSHLELGLVTIEVIIGLLQKSPGLKTMNSSNCHTIPMEEMNSALCYGGNSSNFFYKTI